MSKFIQEHRIENVNEAAESVDEVTRLKNELDAANARIKELEAKKKKKKKTKEPSSLDGKQFLRIGAVAEVPASEFSFSGFLVKALEAELNKPKGKKKEKKKKDNAENA